MIPTINDLKCCGNCWYAKHSENCESICTDTDTTPIAVISCLRCRGWVWDSIKSDKRYFGM
jgi:hypothetical protein